MTCALFMLVLAGGVSIAAPPDPVTYYHTLEQAREAYRARDPQKTVTLLGKLTDRTPDSPELWYLLARSYERLGKLTQAIAAAERVQRLGYTGRPRMSYRLARMYAQTGDESAALDWLERALAERFEDRPGRPGIQDDGAFAALRDNPRFIKLAGILPTEEVSRDEGLRFDLDYLVEEAQRMHADPSRPAFSQRFEAEAAALRKAIPAMNDAEVLAAMMHLIAILDDGHSAIYSLGPDSPLDVSLNRLPLKFYLFPEGLFIVDGEGDAAAYAGSKVLRFGDLAAEEVMRRLSESRGVDNAMTWKWMGPQFYVGSLTLLHSVGATDSTDAAVLTLSTADGGEKTVEIAGGNFEIRRKLRPSPAAVGKVPIYLSQVDTNYWLKPLPDHSALYFQFNQVRDAEGEKITEFAQRLWARLASGNIDNVIVDVRHNNGGNNSLVRPMIRVLVAFEMASLEHRIFVITGRNTFSAAQNFINRVESWTNAVFVGEPSSSRPNFIGEETNLRLPYSRIFGSISTRFWQDSNPGDERAWISPDIPVVLSAGDYFSNRDPALEAILEILAPDSK